MNNKKRKIKNLTIALSATGIAGTAIIGAVAQACGDGVNSDIPVPNDIVSGDFTTNNVYEYSNWENNGDVLAGLFASNLLITSASLDNPYAWKEDNSGESVIAQNQRWWLNNPAGETPTINYSLFSTINALVGLFPSPTGDADAWTVNIDENTQTATGNSLQAQIETGYVVFSATVGLFSLFDTMLRDLYSIDASDVMATDPNGIANQALRWVDLFVANPSYATLLNAKSRSEQLISVRNAVISGIVQVLWSMHYRTIGDLNFDTSSGDERLDLVEGQLRNPYWYFFDYESLLLTTEGQPTVYNGDANLWTFMAEFLPNYIFQDPMATIAQTTGSEFDTLLEAINSGVAAEDLPFVLNTTGAATATTPQEIFVESNVAGTTPTVVSLTENYYYRNLALMFNGINGHQPDATLTTADIGARIEYLADLPAEKAGNISVNVNITSSTPNGDIISQTILTPRNVQNPYSEIQLNRYIIAFDAAREQVYYPVVSGFYMNAFLNPINVANPFERSENNNLVPTDYVILTRSAN